MIVVLQRSVEQCLLCYQSDMDEQHSDKLSTAMNPVNGIQTYKEKQDGLD